MLVENTSSADWSMGATMAGCTVKNLALSFDVFQISIKIGWFGKRVATEETRINCVNMDLYIS